MKGTETMLNEEAIASAILRAASMLGNGNASTPMGAIEAHGLKSFEGMAQVSDSLDGIAYSLELIADAINALAEAVKEKG